MGMSRAPVVATVPDKALGPATATVVVQVPVTLLGLELAMDPVRATVSEPVLAAVPVTNTPRTLLAMAPMVPKQARAKALVMDIEKVLATALATGTARVDDTEELIPIMDTVRVLAMVRDPTTGMVLTVAMDTALNMVLATLNGREAMVVTVQDMVAVTTRAPVMVMATEQALELVVATVLGLAMENMFPMAIRLELAGRIYVT